ncbi:MAG: N-formylglutamate amidohydrolase, partial [Candidatus Lokiarchaeota archaeon]|nr:N-formylglutamate amidohydrolase [Candidatus Lokiarchaeota archaeon]
MRSSNSVEKNILTLKGFIEIPGNLPVLLTAPHARRPRDDLFTGEIAYRVAVETGSYALIATVSREDQDYNRPKGRESPFRKRVQEIIADILETHSEVLLLDIHGKAKPSTYLGDEITVIFGTVRGRSIDADYIDMLREELRANYIRGEYAFTIGAVNYVGGDIVRYHGKPSRGVHAVQLEIASQNRQLGEQGLITAIVNFIRRWDLTKQYKHEFKKTQMRRLLKEAGAKRISQDAPEVLRDI